MKSGKAGRDRQIDRPTIFQRAVDSVQLWTVGIMKSESWPEYAQMRN